MSITVAVTEGSYVTDIFLPGGLTETTWYFIRYSKSETRDDRHTCADSKRERERGGGEKVRERKREKERETKKEREKRERDKERARACEREQE